jgi:type I restriction enzyme M protein
MAAVGRASFTSPHFRNVWYTKTAPIQFEEFADCVQWWGNRQEHDRAWRVPVTELLAKDSR